MKRGDMGALIARATGFVIGGLWVTQLQAEVQFLDYDYARFNQDVTRCDELASHVRDPGHIAPGVSSSGMDKDAAIAACREAVAADPDNPRLNYQLGRAYGYSGRGEDAMPYRLKALAADYPQSLFVIGYLYFLGQTIEQDHCKTVELWQRAARYQRLAALISLPRQYIRGDFEACEVNISAAELRAYLERARTVSGDYYVGMLVTDLLDELDRWEASE